jgi:rhodanese-related sulfurtransferase
MISSSLSKPIEARELADRLKAGEIINLLDVREAIEYYTYNIGGMNMPLQALKSKIGEITWAKDDEIIVICKIGLRSQTAKAILEENGYTHIRNLEGGLMGLRRISQ